MCELEREVQKLSAELVGTSRQNVARLIHEKLLLVYKEGDEQDISAASVLKDLYDCRTCVNHVAQVFLKGIMRPGETVFGMRELVTEEEALLIAERTLKRDRRIPQKQEDKGAKEPMFLSWEQVSEIEADYLIDVRPMDESVEEEAVRVRAWTRVSLEEYCRNPFMLTMDIHAVIIILCENGMRSKLAASCAANVGFRNVYYTRLQ